MTSTESGRPLVFSRLVDRQARVGDITDQCRSTWDKIGEALELRQADDALALAEFAVEHECRFVYDILTGWSTEIRALLARRGVSDDELDRVDERLRRLLAYPDGKPYSPEAGWNLLGEAKQSLRRRIEAGAWEEAEAIVPTVCEAWRVLHDRVVDSSFGWMSAFVERFGETAVPEMYEEIGGDHFAEFFALADPERRAWDDEGRAAVLLDTVEAMRIHLSTVRRDGAPIELIEHEDRWEMTFDPCGSGGRALRGDIVEGTPSRLEPPYEFAYIEGAYDWTDGKSGMCVYCNHCQLLYEQWPMDRAGIPYLVVDPPTYPEGVGHDDPQRCRYTIYKTAEAVPDEVYARCGKKRQG
jgi:hypothetical protein